MKTRKILLYTAIFCALGTLSYYWFESCYYNLVTDQELVAVREKLQLIPTDERSDLAYFFSNAVVLCQYPYTLIGYKPMSISNYLQDSDDLSPLLRAEYEKPLCQNFSKRLERGFDAWKRYEHLFDIQKFSIVSYHISSSKGSREVALMHKELCRQTIEMHLDVFSPYLDAPTSSAQQVLDVLSNPLHQHFHTMQEDEFLLGILLGYGINNAKLFKANERQKLTFFSNEWIFRPKKWLLPGFCCDASTEETKHLKSTYKKARRYIRWTYFNRDDLEVTLALLQKT